MENKGDKMVRGQLEVVTIWLSSEKLLNLISSIT
jgi:hypothetical protein